MLFAYIIYGGIVAFLCISGIHNDFFKDKDKEA